MDILGLHFPETRSGYDLFDDALVDNETMAILQALHPFELRLVRTLSGYEGLDQHLFQITHEFDEAEDTYHEIKPATPKMLSDVVEAIAYCYFKETFAGDLFPVLDRRDTSFLPEVQQEEDFDKDYHEGEAGLRYPGITEETAHEWVWNLEYLTHRLRREAYAEGRMFRAEYRLLTGTDLYFTDETYSDYVRSKV